MGLKRAFYRFEKKILKNNFLINKKQTAIEKIPLKRNCDNKNKQSLGNCRLVTPALVFFFPPLSLLTDY